MISSKLYPLERKFHMNILILSEVTFLINSFSVTEVSHNTFITQASSILWLPILEYCLACYYMHAYTHMQFLAAKSLWTTFTSAIEYW